MNINLTSIEVMTLKFALDSRKTAMIEALEYAKKNGPEKVLLDWWESQVQAVVDLEKKIFGG